MLEAQQILQQRYQLQTPLGRTAAGRQTWLANDLQSEEQVTVKLLAFAPNMQWEELKLFEREADILKTLNHPRIPRYRDYFSLDREEGEGVPWFGLVQDYIPGHSFQELLEKGQRWNEEQVCDIAVDILEILVYLHELSPPVLHRDLKPSNLIWGEDNQVYLVDFGAVQGQAAVTGVTFTVVGTSGYAPLEQFWGRAVAASDLYALGATLIHLLTGIAPAELPQKDCRIQFSDRTNISSNLVKWIEHLTETAVEKRPQSAREAFEDFFQETNTSGEVQIQTWGSYNKPRNSLVSLQKSPETLEISIPAPGRNLINQGNCLRVCLYFFGGFGVSVFLLSELDSLFFYFLGLPLMIKLVALGSTLFILSRIIQHFFEKTHLHFNRNNFSLYRETFFLTYGQQRSRIIDILSVFLVEKSGLSGNRHQIRIRTHKNHQLGTRSHKNHKFGFGLQEQECAWLIQEIQDWIHYS